MIYINFVELLSLIFLANFQNNMPPGSGEDLKMFYSHGSHFGHLTWIINTTFGSFIQTLVPALALIGSAVPEEKTFKHYGRRRHLRLQPTMGDGACVYRGYLLF